MLAGLLWLTRQKIIVPKKGEVGMIFLKNHSSLLASNSCLYYVASMFSFFLGQSATEMTGIIFLSEMFIALAE